MRCYGKGERRDERPSFPVYKIRSHFCMCITSVLLQNHEKKPSPGNLNLVALGVGIARRHDGKHHSRAKNAYCNRYNEEEVKTPIYSVVITQDSSSESNGYIFFKTQARSKISAKHDCCTKNTTEV